ncbi:hypothetical protein BaRGS_00035071, partial [Batillaria attramentaria]
MSATIEIFYGASVIRISLLLCYLSLAVRSDEHAIGSKFQAEKIERKKCQYNLKMLWHTDVGTSPFAAPPLVADIDGGGGLEVAAAPFSESITVLDGNTGKQLTDSHWPLHNLESTFHASPLQYDIDGDGFLDILLVSSSGEIIFYRDDGVLLGDFSYQGPDHVSVDAHVYATPVLIDINRDGVIDELVVSTTHMFVEEDY